MEHMEIAFLLLIGACVVAFLLGNEYAKYKASNTSTPGDKFVYQIKEGNRGRYRLSIYDAGGRLVLISPVRGTKTEQAAEDVIKRLSKAEFVYTADAFF